MLLNFTPILACIGISVALIESDIHAQTEVNISLKSICGDVGNSSCHEEIPRASEHRYISVFSKDWIGSSERDGAFVICRVEHKGESEPGAEGVFHIIKVESLSSANGMWMEIVIQRDGIVEHHQISEVIVDSEDGEITPLGSPHNRRCCVLGVDAIVKDIVEIQHQIPTRLQWNPTTSSSIILGIRRFQQNSGPQKNP